MLLYSKIFKQALEFTRKNKFLWIFGLFLSFGSTVFWPDEKDLSFNLPAWFGFVLLVVFLMIYFRCKASMIIGIKAVLDKQETSSHKSYMASKFFYSRVFVVYMITQLAALVLGGLIAVPIAYMFEQNKLPVAITFLVIGLFIFIPIAVTAALVSILAPMFVVVYDLTPREAVKRSLELISEFWLPLSSLALLMFLPQLLVLLVSVPIVFLADLPYHMIGFPLMILGLLVLWIIHSIITVFQQTVWVLVFQNLIRPQKLEDEETVVLPEVAS
jgi:hypothetical protein